METGKHKHHLSALGTLTEPTGFGTASSTTSFCLTAAPGGGDCLGLREGNSSSQAHTAAKGQGLGLSDLPAPRLLKSLCEPGSMNFPL